MDHTLEELYEKLNELPMLGYEWHRMIEAIQELEG